MPHLSASLPTHSCPQGLDAAEASVCRRLTIDLHLQECQAASVSLLHYVSPLSDGLLSATAAVCGMDSVPTSVVDKAMDIIGLLGDSGRQAPAEVVSFIVTVGMLAQGDDEGERGSLIAGMCSEQVSLLIARGCNIHNTLA